MAAVHRCQLVKQNFSLLIPRFSYELQGPPLKKKNREETVQHVNNISGCVRKEVGQPILYGKTFFFSPSFGKGKTWIFFFSLSELQIVCVETQVFLFLEPFRNDCQ